MNMDKEFGHVDSEETIIEGAGEIVTAEGVRDGKPNLVKDTLVYVEDGTKPGS